MSDQLVLWEASVAITVHCMFHCKHSGRMIVSPDPNHAHDLMEAHYRRYHQAEIDQMIGGEA
jgi:hypothetical protein